MSEPHDLYLEAAARNPTFPRSAQYDPEWQVANTMGPHALWMLEGLLETLDLPPGARVLDLGCGRAMSSIFLAKELGVRVWATDLWISADDNWTRIKAAGVEDLVCPIHAEAHDLDYGAGFFDTIVSIDAYHYFGTDDLYLAYVAKFLRPGGQLAIVVPGVLDELADGPPPHLGPYWEAEFATFHSPHWWRNHWEKSGALDVEVADSVPDGCKHWQAWAEVCADYQAQHSLVEWSKITRRDADMLRVDGGRTLGLTRVVGRKKAEAGAPSAG